MRIKKSIYTAAFVLLSGLISGGVHAQEPRGESLRPLLENAALQGASDRQEPARPQRAFRPKAAGNPAKAGETKRLTLPFFEDFSQDGPYPSPERWADKTVFVNNTFPLYPPTYGVATFDGLDAEGKIYSQARAGASFWADTLTVLPLRLDSIFDPEPRALTPADSVYISFWYQPGGGLGATSTNTCRGTAPTSSDVLNLEFFTPIDSSWFIAWSSQGMDMETFCPNWDSDTVPVQDKQYFRQVMVPVTSIGHFHKDFRFRFRSRSTIDANEQSTGGQWHIDYIYINANRSRNETCVSDVAFAGVSPSLLKDYSQVPRRQFTPSMLRQNLDVRFANFGEQLLSCHYQYELLDAEGSQLSLYPADEPLTFQLFPFFSDGYRTSPEISSAPLRYAFDDLQESYTLRHILSSGIHNTYSAVNDTITLQQFFGNEFAYDDGSAEAGWGLNYAQGTFAYAFELTQPDTLTAVKIFFNRSFGNENIVPFNLVVWNAGTTDTAPGEILYKKENLKVKVESGINRFVHYALDTNLMLPAGKFHIGIEQTSDAFLNIGFDKNSDLQGKILYSYYDPIQHTWSWYTSLYTGALMMRPVFGAEGAGEPTTANEKRTACGKIHVQPNPVHNGTLHVELPENLSSQTVPTVRIFDMRGREVYREKYQETLSVGGLGAGVYVLRLTQENRVIGFTKIVVL
ncbi:MAG: T9SS type A sorting domain-containing protein [Bacteroidales bacterium]|nr:T9SS type A sorting domain-containing protein [Bacteroidales bacterium]